MPDNNAGSTNTGYVDAKTGLVKGRVSLDFSRGEESIQDAIIRNWRHLEVEVRVWHPRLEWLEQLIENKLRRGDIDAFEANIREYIDCVDEMSRAALYKIMHKIEQYQKQLSHIVVALIVFSTAIYIWKPLVGAALDCIGICALFSLCWMLEKRKKLLIQYLIGQEHNKTERCEAFGKAFALVHQQNRGVHA